LWSLSKEDGLSEGSRPQGVFSSCSLSCSCSEAARGCRILPDGRAANQKEILYTFESVGNHCVELVVSDYKRATDSAIIVVTVFDPAEEEVSHVFNPEAGTTLQTDCGLEITVFPGALPQSSQGLSVKYYSDPPQPEENCGVLISAYSIDATPGDTTSSSIASRGLMGQIDPGITLSFDIPQGMDLTGILVVYRSEDGWVVTPNENGRAGGDVSSDGTRISLATTHLSDYGLYGVTPNDGTKLVDNLSPDSTLSSAPPSAPSATGNITIPEGLFPEGQGEPIPVFVPSLDDGSNALGNTDEWKAVKVITEHGVKYNWANLAANLNPDDADSPQGAAFSLVAALVKAFASVPEPIELRVTIQQDSSGDRRAVIEVGDPSKATWQRKLAGSSEAIGGLQYSDLKYHFVQAIARKLGLPDNHNYWLVVESDAAHRGDAYVGYLSLDENGNVAFTPKMYEGDKISVVHLAYFIKRVIDVEIPVANIRPNWYSPQESAASTFMDVLYPMQLTEQAAPPQNTKPVADAGPDLAAVVGEEVTLDGSGSTDADGDALAYQWEKVQGSAVSLDTQPDSATAVFTPATSGTYKFKLVVNDGTVDSEPDYVEVEVRDASAQEVTLSLYVHEGSSSGPKLSGVQVQGYDGSGSSFNKTTNSSGYVTITGTPGSWHFTASKSGYQTNTWDQSITTTGRRDAFLYKEAPANVTLTLYVHEGSASGPTLSGVQVQGNDGGGNPSLVTRRTRGIRVSPRPPPSMRTSSHYQIRPRHALYLQARGQVQRL